MLTLFFLRTNCPKKTNANHREGVRTMVDSRCICERLKPGQGWILWPGEGWEVWLVRRKNGRDYSLEFRVSEGRLIRERTIEEERGLGYRLLRILRRPSDAVTVPIRYCPRCGRPLYEEMAEV